MATLTAWKFDTPDGAEQAVATLKSLASQELIKVHDAARPGTNDVRPLMTGAPGCGTT